jgi:hypothetical protein
MDFKFAKGPSICANCFASSHNRCSKCKFTRYCSKKCQTDHWTYHQSQCFNMGSRAFEIQCWEKSWDDIGAHVKSVAVTNPIVEMKFADIVQVGGIVTVATGFTVEKMTKISKEDDILWGRKPEDSCLLRMLQFMWLHQTQNGATRVVTDFKSLNEVQTKNLKKLKNVQVVHVTHIEHWDTMYAVTRITDSNVRTTPLGKATDLSTKDGTLMVFTSPFLHNECTIVKFT